MQAEVWSLDFMPVFDCTLELIAIFYEPSLVFICFALWLTGRHHTGWLTVTVFICITLWLTFCVMANQTCEADKNTLFSLRFGTKAPVTLMNTSTSKCKVICHEFKFIVTFSEETQMMIPARLMVKCRMTSNVPITPHGL